MQEKAGEANCKCMLAVEMEKAEEVSCKCMEARGEAAEVNCSGMDEKGAVVMVMVEEVIGNGMLV